MHTVNLFTRRTFRYVDGWSHEDKWDFLTAAKITPRKLVREPDDIADGGTYVSHMRVPAGVDKKALIAAIEDTMSGGSCRHEYDCCGCATTRARVEITGPRTLAIRLHVSYNY